jgi:hypothetical protein
MIGQISQIVEDPDHTFQTISGVQSEPAEWAASDPVESLSQRTFLGPKHRSTSTPKSNNVFPQKSAYSSGNPLAS